MRVTLNGLITDDNMAKIYTHYGYSAFGPATIRQAIADNPKGEPLVLELNSGGGDVFAGFEMYSLLMMAACKTVVEVQSIAASAASTLMCGANRVVMSPVAQVMVHLPTVATWGNEHDHRRDADALASIKQSILNGYCARCGDKASRERLEELVTAETYLTAQDAIALGLADEILGGETVQDFSPSMFINAVGGIPNPDVLRKQYAVDNAKKPEPETNWQDEATLFLAQAKYKF